MQSLLERLPKKVLALLVIIATGLLLLVVIYAVLVQKRPISFWGMRVGESQEELQKELSASKDELGKRVSATVYEETKVRAAQAEARSAASSRDVERLKADLAEARTAQQKAEAKATGAETDRAAAKQAESEAARLRGQVADLEKRVHDSTAAISDLRAKYDAQERSLASTRQALKQVQATPFTILVSGSFRHIYLIDGDLVEGESATLGGRSDTKTVAVPKDRTVKLQLTGGSNTIFAPATILRRIVIDDRGTFNTIRESN